jgi:hypothetical protein
MPACISLSNGTARWVLFGAICASCASGPTQTSPYDAFLNKIAAACKPLVIGSDDMGQALSLGGTGVDSEHYTTFLSQTRALYAGSISSSTYRDALAAFIGAGRSTDRSIDCIVANLPKQ